jgi:rSAM/selenodomain-associated transferase 1
MPGRPHSHSAFPRDTLGVFAKYWLPGAVKTRLAAHVGNEGAAALYKQFLKATLHRTRGVAQRRVLAFTPAGRRHEFAALAGSGWQCEPQAEGDLGTRMRRFFAEQLAEEVSSAGEERTAAARRRVVLIGSDSPTIPVPFIQQAFAILDQVPLVLGPTPDGGYYLVGAAGRVPPIFGGIEWSTPQVWRQTVESLAAAGRPFARLPEWYDVDEPADLLRLREEASRLVRDDPVWKDLLAMLGDD